MATNPWMAHVKQFRKQNPGLQYKDLLQQARKSYRGGTPVSYVSNGVATNASKVGGDPVAYESQNLASRSAKLGGSRRKRQTRKQKKSRRSRK